MPNRLHTLQRIVAGAGQDRDGSRIDMVGRLGKQLQRRDDASECCKVRFCVEQKRAKIDWMGSQQYIPWR